ncbi:MAG: twin-arginine translocase subunit TatC [Nitrosopumilaceae archaeon]|nr:twin-arginine translocase subunit TatC [Nitrosopumilaceae archaeon]NIU02498.1 twin-arginine translocase subunit TatC [Nitrosopumilaceae archaeon]NIU88959.1 twin-arginine translocase subunit TatC [Nitrosopumilaceae archaeon]NIV67070.1 twin-arginine translocase subunit TatC [Nitrosopumilaceae archaeon]NIX63099.1 twin-arginine translocase subunit TatC [Nitrosopumilaceae archaeon]
MSEFQEFSKHLEELRSRLLRIVIVIGIITAFVLTFHAEPFELLGTTFYYPTPDPLNNIAAQITNFMKTNLIPEEVQLIQTAPGQAFFAQVYIAALVGLVCGMPIVVREAVSFLRPALKENEIKVSRTITVPAIGLFVGGCLFAYFFVIPHILEFLYRYGESSGLITFLNVIDFVTFVLQFLLAFGLSFQLPMIMYATTKSGLTDVVFWRKNIRYAIVIIVIFGAIITPDGSGVTMWFIAGPMIGLYLAGMAIIERSEKKKPV